MRTIITKVGYYFLGSLSIIQISNAMVNFFGLWETRGIFSMRPFNWSSQRLSFIAFCYQKTLIIYQYGYEVSKYAATFDLP